jgi:hypothetical protein
MLQSDVRPASGQAASHRSSGASSLRLSPSSCFQIYLTLGIQQNESRRSDHFILPRQIGTVIHINIDDAQGVFQTSICAAALL